MRLLLVFAAVSALAQSPTRILIAYHSDTGNTEKLAQAIQEGAASVEGVEVKLRKGYDVVASDIREADGIIVGTPVHWSNASAETKKFLDFVGETIGRTRGMGDGRTAGSFCTGGMPSMGKDVARLSILSTFLVMRFIIIGGVEAQGFGTLGPQATTGRGYPGVGDAEREEGRRFGERFARYTRQFRSGAPQD